MSKRHQRKMLKRLLRERWKSRVGVKLLHIIIHIKSMRVPRRKNSIWTLLWKDTIWLELSHILVNGLSTLPDKGKRYCSLFRILTLAIHLFISWRLQVIEPVTVPSSTHRRSITCSDAPAKWCVGEFLITETNELVVECYYYYCCCCCKLDSQNIQWQWDSKSLCCPSSWFCCWWWCCIVAV